MDLPNLQLVSGDLPSDLARYLLTREAILWVGTGFDTTFHEAANIARLVILPWQAVLMESSRGEMAREVESRSSTLDRFARIRGFVHLIAENPTDLTRSPRSLPVFMLNGRSDATDTASASTLTGTTALLRRLSMREEVRKLRPRVLVVLTDGSPKMLEDIFELWGTGGFVPQLVFLDPLNACGPAIEAWLKKTKVSTAVDRCVLPVHAAIDRLVTAIESTLPDDRLVVRMLRDGGQTIEVDLSMCEQVEDPLLNRFDLILSRYLVPIIPGDLTDTQINQFFEGSTNPPTDDFGRPMDNGWAAFCAGLPWTRRTDLVDITLGALASCLRNGSDRNRIILLPSEPGAGGTTLARLAAFSAAKVGYPALLARGESFRATASEVGDFLTRAAERAREVTKEDSPGETPWLIVFDVAHWRGREAEAVGFLREITRRGRAAVMLCVVEDIANPFRLGRREVDVADKVCHDISQEDAEELGAHLNKFLVPRGRGMQPADWVAFWNKHSPLASGALASFWVALSFWLRRQLDLNETIQGWLARQFRSASVPEGAWQLVLEVAALSVERQGAPGGLLASSPMNAQVVDVLEEVRKAVPSLALHGVGSGDRVWYIAHELLGRLLLNIVFYDRDALTRFALTDAQDPIHLRLLLLRRIAVRKALERKAYQPLALEFPSNILKLDDGRLEFARYWRDVLVALDGMPSAFRNTSRTYNHHAAITRRRICTIRDYFDLTAAQRKELLQEAVWLLEKALDLPPVGMDIDSDLNMYNSLSLACQDLANVERELGADDTRLRALWKRSTEAAEQARRLSPRGSRVLETLARNLILTAQLYPEAAAERAAQALGYVYEAMSLENAADRQRQLLKYAQQAIELLRDPAASSQANRMAAAGNPFGRLALAWLELSGAEGQLEVQTLAAFPIDRIRRALTQLEAVTEPNPLVLQLRYELTVAADKWDFDAQLAILDALQVSVARMPLQLRLERAILLHENDRHKEANELFDEVRQANWESANQEYLTVPEYLQWLLLKNETTGRQVKRVCDAQVIARRSTYKQFAKVRQLLDAQVPYNPREFPSTFRVRHQFKCYISFGPNGPLIKPAVGEESVE